MSTRIGLAGVFAAGLALILWGCGGTHAVTASINERAALSGNLPWNPLRWKVITASVDKRAQTMSTLYGNDTAVQYARSNSQQNYPAGSVLSLVTWAEQEDTRWFGGNIPGQPTSVEFVTVATGPDNQPSYAYESYEGSPLIRKSVLSGASPGTRAMYLLSLRAAVMP